MSPSKRVSGLSMLIVSILLTSPLSLFSQEEQSNILHVDTIDTSADIFHDTEPMLNQTCR